MLIEFANSELKRLYHDAEYITKGYHRELIDKYVKVVLFLSVINDVRSLFNRPGLRCEKLGGDSSESLYSIRLNKQWRLLFALHTYESVNIVTIEKLSKHYE